MVGRATRLAQFLSTDEKEYVAGVRLGWATATYDAEERTVRGERGELIVLPPQRPAPDVGEADVRAGADRLRRHRIAQLPPPFSAKKIGGTPAYLLARLQKDVALKPADVTVKALELVALQEGLATLRIVCSSGFYVRSLAHDLGQRLGCGAHLESLRRTRAGEFTAAQATPLDVIQAEGVEALARLLPLPSLLSKLPQVVVNERGAKRAAHGNALATEDLSESDVATLPGRRRRARSACSTPTARSWRSANGAGAAFCNRSLSWCKILSPLELDVRRRGRSPPCGGLKGGHPLSRER